MSISEAISRSSRPEVFCKKGALINFPKLTWKHLCQSFFFNKVAGLTPVTSLKKRPWSRCFPVNFVKFLRTHFFIEHLWWLLLYFAKILIIDVSMTPLKTIQAWVATELLMLNSKVYLGPCETSTMEGLSYQRLLSARNLHQRCWMRS